MTTWKCLYARNRRLRIDMTPPDVPNDEQMVCDRLAILAIDIYGENVQVEVYTDQIDVLTRSPSGRYTKVATYMAGE